MFMKRSSLCILLCVVFMFSMLGCSAIKSGAREGARDGVYYGLFGGG